MADLITRLSLANREFNSGIDSSKKKVKELQDTADDASKSINDLGTKGSRSAKELLSQLSNTEQTARSASNYKRQLMEIQRTIADLTIGYRAMNDEMKNSALGQEVAAKIAELTEQAGMYKDAIEDANASVRALASDTAVWDGVKMGIDTASSALQGFVAMGVLGEESTEKLVAVIAKLKAIEAGTNAIIKVGNALQKQSALMMGIATIQAKALARAKALEATATKGATVAQRLFNTVAKANPYVLLASAVIAVGTALFAFAKREKEATEIEKKHQEQIEREKKELDDWASRVGNSVGSVLSKYRLLQIEYSKLETKTQKLDWIKQNKNEFESLGLKVNDVSSAEATFVGNTNAVVDALKRRALAAARQAQLTELYSKLIEAQTKAEANYNSRQVQAGGKVGGVSHNSATGNEYVDRNGNWVYTAKGATEANKRIYKEAYAEANKIQEEIDKLAASIGADLNVSDLFKITTNGNDNSIKAEVGSLVDAQNKANALHTTLNNMSPDNPKFEETKNLLADALKNVDRIKKILSSSEQKESLSLIPNSLSEATHFVQVFQKQLSEIDPNSDEFAEVLELLNIWKKRVEEINGLINGTGKEVKSVVDKYKEITSKASDINLQLSIGAITFDDAKSQIDALNKQLADLGLTARVKLEVDQNSVKSTADSLRDFVSTMDKVGSLSSGVSAINDVVSSISNLSKKIEEAENGWEQFFAIFQVGMNIFNATATVIETVSTVMDLLTAAKTAATAATTAQTAAVSDDAAAQAADAAAATTNAAAHGAGAAAKAGESVANIPYVGPVLAIAAIASVMAAIIGIISTAKGFATGGIVGGNSYHGDKILTRLNSGELVLNQKQQNKLWDIINSDKNDTTNNIGQVTFKVHGTDLVGCLNNYSKKINKI